MKRHLPDENQIHRLREYLWSGTDIGRAAVMVGAGFSRNAQRLSPTAPGFPLWGDLVGGLYDELYAGAGVPAAECEQRKAKATAGLGALRVAGEYEAAFGRTALDQRLQDIIGETRYSPGNAHRLLLSLPWSDVFTTNYDALLERTRPAVHQRKYDLIERAADIPGKAQPRIVKLHGSFPSHRPFIITEEDFRRYPADFAPFVNTVQQSMMENAFCLLGFSGDDPNFLLWSGWVRDQLGKTAPRIYLAGVLDLTASQRRLLEQRNVIPIDLSPLFGIADYPNPDHRYGSAAEWFLLSLLAGAPPDPRRWPTFRPPQIPKPSAGVPELIPSTTAVLQTDTLFERAESVEQLRAVAARWREVRLRYPGWVILPAANRDTLWLGTRFTLGSMFPRMDSLLPNEQISVLFEVVWRLGVCLLPIDKEIETRAVSVLESINPFHDRAQLPEARYLPDRKETAGWEWEYLGEAWVDLAFSLAVDARWEMDRVKFSRWVDRLEKVVERDPSWLATWHHEKCLFFLQSFDLDSLKEELLAWPPSPDLPFWEVRRAAIMAEIGRFADAERIAVDALDSIRSRTCSSNSRDYALLSQEGWAMTCLKMVRDAQSKGTNPDGGTRDRLDQLERFSCNPWTELSFLRTATAAIPSRRQSKETRYGFDPGDVQTTHHTTGDITPLIPAYAFLRLFEKAGQPVRCAEWDAGGDAIGRAASAVFESYPYWAVAWLIRGDKRDALDELFSRSYVATLTNDEVTRFHDWFEPALGHALKQCENRSLDAGRATLSYRLVNRLSELLSRLAFRLDGGGLERAIGLAMRAFHHPVLSKDLRVDDAWQHLLGRSLLPLSPEALGRVCLQLLTEELPALPDALGNPSGRDPFACFEWQELPAGSVHVPRKGLQRTIPRLLSGVESGNPTQRYCACRRLAVLDSLQVLGKSDRAKFAKALWKKTDPGTGLPCDSPLFPDYALDLGRTQRPSVREEVKQKLLAFDIESLVAEPPGKLADAAKRCTTAQRIRSYWEIVLRFTVGAKRGKTQVRETWSPQETEALWGKLSFWWNVSKGNLQPVQSDGPFAGWEAMDTFRRSLQIIPAIVLRVVLPRLSLEPQSSCLPAVKSMCRELEAKQLITKRTAFARLFWEPTAHEEMAAVYRRGLNAGEEAEVRDTILGIVEWLRCSSQGKLPGPDTDLVNEIFGVVAFRRQPGLDTAISESTRLVEEFPSVLGEGQIPSLKTGLRYLRIETELRREDCRAGATGGMTAIPVQQRPFCRELSARLAFSLSRHLRSKGREVPQGILEWQEACRNDVLPEVRRAWPQTDGCKDEAKTGCCRKSDGHGRRLTAAKTRRRLTRKGQH